MNFLKADWNRVLEFAWRILVFVAGPRARVRQAKAAQVAALASFDEVVLTALEGDRAGSRLVRCGTDLLTTEQSLIALDAAVAASEAALVRDQIAVFKALGGGWRDETQGPAR
jgi:outer membrane protein TolC